MGLGLHGIIRFQEGIYVSSERGGYVVLTTMPGDVDEKSIAIHVTNVEALICLLTSAKASLDEGAA